MSKVEIKELKAVTNQDFFPQHYMTGALADDAKSREFTGKSIKSIRADIEKQVEEISETKDSENVDLLNKTWIKLFQYFDHEDVSSGTVSFDIQNKEFSIKVERLIALKGDGQLAVISDDSVNSSNSEEADESAGNPPKNSETGSTSWGSFPVTHKDEETSMSWENILNGIFNSDHCDVEWVVLFQGDRFMLVEKGKWQEIPGSHIGINGAELVAVNSEESYRVVESLFHSKSFPIDSADSFHDQVAQNAHKKAAEVTKALRETVRESVELIANEVLIYHSHSPIEELAKFDLNDSAERQAAAKIVFDQSLRYIYRILFMLFTESQDQRKGALPVQSKSYQMGYAVEKLRELETVSLLGNGGALNNFIQQTLARTFKIYFGGYRSTREKHTDEKTGKTEYKTDKLGFSFPAIGTALFDPDRTPILQKAMLTDGCMQQVIKSLSLAKIGSGKKTRTFRVHYANLGINQLGAVYEGLLSLKPEILGERVALLKRDKKDQAHRFVPYSKMKTLKGVEYAQDDLKNVIMRDTGEFMLTPVGLERKFSASFYTPEVLTNFLVKESVDALLGEKPSLEKMENLKICEPAMGSGAFLNAVVNEIAPKMAKYYHQEDQKAHFNYVSECEKNGKAPSKDEGPEVFEMHHYISKAKEHMMTHCVFGVDLNATAVELAKISLWLNCLHEDGNLPFLDFKLKHGNSLVGCWINDRQIKEGIKHFLLPNPNSLEPHLSGKVLGKTLFIEDKDELNKYKNLKKNWQEAHSNKKLESRLTALSARVDELYSKHLEIRKSKREELAQANSAEEKSEIFNKYIQEDCAYNQLRSMMDYWCSLWFWEHALLDELPTAEEYILAMEWMAETPLAYGGTERTKQIEESGIEALKTSREISLQQNFFHWDLEYAEIFEIGGFDLVLGNPPWAKVLWEEEDFFESVRPGMHAVKLDSKKKQTLYLEILAESDDLVQAYIQSKIKTMGLISFLNNSSVFPIEDHSQTNTYKYFYQRFRQVCTPNGIQAMIAQDGILSDSGNLDLRKIFYSELKNIFRFQNSASLFEDVGCDRKFSVWITEKAKQDISFKQHANLYLPHTVHQSRIENQSAQYPGMKNSSGKFETRGHPLRIVSIDESVLKSFARFEGSSDPFTASLPIIHGSVELEVLKKFARHPIKLGDIEFSYWSKFHETGGPKAGLISRKPGKPKSLSHAVMTGPNIFVSTPANKQPNPGCKSMGDFSKVDLEQVPDDFFPDTVFQCTEKGLKSDKYNSKTPWGEVHTSLFRICSRQMVHTTGIRTLSSAILPPGPTHINNTLSLAHPDRRVLVSMSGLFHSILFDFLCRATTSGLANQSILNNFPSFCEKQRTSMLMVYLNVRVLRLNSISRHYNDLWSGLYNDSFLTTEISPVYSPKLPYNELNNLWTRNTCIRNWKEREQALCEIDAIVAHLFDFKKDILLNLYRSQFGVLQKSLQDLPSQKVTDQDTHFPRYQQMSLAYDVVEKLLDKNQTTPKRKQSQKVA